MNSTPTQILSKYPNRGIKNVLSKQLLFSSVLISMFFSELQALETASEIWRKIGELGVDKAKQKLKVLAEKEPADYEAKYRYASLILDGIPTDMERDEATKYLSEILDNQPSEPGWLLKWAHARMGQSHAQLASLHFRGKNENAQLSEEVKPFVENVVDREFRFLKAKAKPKLELKKFNDANWPLTREQMEEDLDRLFQLYSENFTGNSVRFPFLFKKRRTGIALGMFLRESTRFKWVI